MKSKGTSLAAAFLLLSLVFIALFQLRPDHIYFTNDGASTMAVAEGMLRGELPLAGPPTARGGRHFGPWYFYWQTFFLWWSDSDVYWAIYFESLAKACLLAAGSLTLLRIIAPSSALWPSVLTMMCAYLGGAWWWMLRTPWHSNMTATISWIYLAFVFSFLFSPKGPKRRLLGLAGTCFLGSLLLQTHIATAPLAAVGIFTMLILFFISWRASSGAYSGGMSERALSILLFFAAVLSWMPTVWYYEKFDSELLPSRTLGGDSLGFRRAALLSASIVRRYLLNDFSSADLFPIGAAAAEALFWMLISLLLFHHAWRGKSFRVPLLITCALFLLYVFSMAPLRAPGEMHYQHSLLILLPVLLGVAASEAYILIAQALNSARRREVPGHWAGALLSCLFFLLLFSAFPRAISENLRALSSTPHPVGSDLAQAVGVSALLQQRALPAERSRLLIDEGMPWRESAVLLFLGPSYYWQMQYARFLKELPTFQARPSELALRGRDQMIRLSCEGGQRNENVARILKDHIQEESLLSVGDEPEVVVDLRLRKSRIGQPPSGAINEGGEQGRALRVRLSKSCSLSVWSPNRNTTQVGQP